jgi:hypothetical protein
MAVGHRIVSFNMQELKAQTLQMRWPVDLTIGSVNTGRGGFYLGSDLDFLQYYIEGTDDKGVVLDYRYDEADIITGHPDESGEIFVAKGTLLNARFYEDHLQEKFGHLLNPEIIQQRREHQRGECMKGASPALGYSLVRAMSTEVNHLFPMDYAYKVDQLSLHKLARSVLKGYEDGSPANGSVEKMLRMTLDHAVTTAIFEGSPQHVTTAVVLASKVYKASNEGEFFYDADVPTKVSTLFHIDAQGLVTMPAAPKRELPEPQSSAGPGQRI